jgi:hypothetical protein
MRLIGAVIALAVLFAPAGVARPPDLAPGLGGVVVTPAGPGYFRQPNMTLVFSENGREVVRARTDARGIFAVSLASGWYGVDADVPDRDTYLKAEMIPARVWVPNRFHRTARLVWDTGIR